MAEKHLYTVVVGVSQTSKSPAALEWGAAQARLNGGQLIAVRVWSVPVPSGSTSGLGAARITDPGDQAEQERNRLAADVAEVLGPDHGAEIRVIHGSKRRGLIAAALGADLLVIDAPRSPSLSPLLAQRIIYAASCPVVVMPPSLSGQPESAGRRVGRAVGRAVVKAAGEAGRPGYRPPRLP